MCASISCSLSFPSFLALLQKHLLYYISTYNHSFALERWGKVYHKIFKNLFQVASRCCCSSMWRNYLWQRLFAHRKKFPFKQHQEMMWLTYQRRAKLYATISHWFLQSSVWKNACKAHGRFESVDKIHSVLYEYESMGKNKNMKRSKRCEENYDKNGDTMSNVKNLLVHLVFMRFFA